MRDGGLGCHSCSPLSSLDLIWYGRPDYGGYHEILGDPIECCAVRLSSLNRNFCLCTSYFLFSWSSHVFNGAK